ncbi:MAG: Uma2 family endonuclease [Anaerolineae bacterium]|nr:Uma2 family endonuclease [Phycisphaerae bacterium]
MTTTFPKLANPQTRRWTREEFYQLAEDGWFEGQRVLLLEGEIIQTPPMKHPHALAVAKVVDVMRKLFPDSWIRQDMPLNATDDSDPEPDIAVLEKPMSAYRDHPETAVLIIEVSDTSVNLDRRKASVYAEANVQDYWILNIRDNQLEVFRQPDRSARKYTDQQIIPATGSIAPLVKPLAVIAVVEMLPT